MKYWLQGTISFARGSLFAKYLTAKGASPTNQRWCHKTRVIALVQYQNNRNASFSFVTIQASDRRTDRQNCDNNTVCCITCSCTVKTEDLVNSDRHNPKSKTTNSILTMANGYQNHETSEPNTLMIRRKHIYT